MANELSRSRCLTPSLKDEENQFHMQNVSFLSFRAAAMKITKTCVETRSLWMPETEDLTLIRRFMSLNLKSFPWHVRMNKRNIKSRGEGD